jgi:hypothetical protein
MDLQSWLTGLGARNLVYWSELLGTGNKNKILCLERVPTIVYISPTGMFDPRGV